jgi:hypothetical protein
MIVGAHSIIYSRSPEADRAFLRDVLKLTHVDVGGGWLIFGLPPAEVAVHPGDKNDVHEFFLMCDDVNGLIASMRAKAIVCSPVQEQPWGLLTSLKLPGGGQIGVYQPRHARPKAMSIARRKGAKKATRKRTPARKSRKVAKKRSRR